MTEYTSPPPQKINYDQAATIERLPRYSLTLSPDNVTHVSHGELRRPAETEIMWSRENAIRSGNQMRTQCLPDILASFEYRSIKAKIILLNHASTLGLLQTHLGYAFHNYKMGDTVGKTRVGLTGWHLRHGPRNKSRRVP